MAGDISDNPGGNGELSPPAKKPIQRNRLEASFLAHVLEIQEKPPSPTARITLLLLVSLVALAILWANLSTVDVVAVALGKIIPDQRTKTVQAAAGGVVSEILVANGDVIKQGQPLFLIDPTNASASLEQARTQHRSAALERAMHDLLVDADTDEAASPPELATFPELDGFSAAHIKRQQELLNEIYQTHLDTINGISLEIKTLSLQKKTELQGAADTEQIILGQRNLANEQEKTVNDEIETLNELLPLAKEEYEALQRLNKNQAVSKLQVNRAEEKYATLRGDLVRQKDRLNEMRAANRLREIELEQKIAGHLRRADEISLHLDERKQALKRVRSEFRALHADAREQSLRQLESLSQEIVKLEREQRAHTILSPTDGRAQQLSLHTVGGVVQPSQVLLVVVPEKPVLRAEVLIENKDIGFVYPEQPVEVKVDTFSYTQYGTIGGKILHISADALQDERLGLVYVADIALEKDTLVGPEGEVRLAPGMSATAEIKLGKRRIIEYILTPFLEASQESLRER